MVWKCEICQSDFQILSIKHFNAFCDHVAKCPILSNNSLADRFSCPSCGKLYERKQSFRDHILTKHGDQILMSPRSKSSNRTKRKAPAYKMNVSVEVAEREEEVTEKNTVDVEFVDTEQSSRTMDFNILKNSLKEVATKLYGRTNMSMKGAEDAMEDIQAILDLSFAYLKLETEEFSKSLPAEYKMDLSRLMGSTFSRIKQAMDPFKTEQRITTNLKRSGLLQLPYRKAYKEKVEQVDNNLRTIKSEAIILPIEHQIRTFLQRPNVLSTILGHQHKMELCPEGTVNHFVNGLLWKKLKSKFCGKEVVPIFIYNDDFNPDDGLGPHGKANKVSGFYYNFPTLPPEHSSTTDTIFVAMLAKSEEMQEAGPDTVLDILVDALSPLEENGIKIGSKQIYISPVLMLGDNLALNVNLGFPGGFGATYFCRFCFMEKDKTGICCKEDSKVLRTKSHYEECIANIGSNGNAKNFGIKSTCSLNKLKSFDVPENFAVDFMHDGFCGGVFHYGIIELITKGIYTKKFTLEQFNQAKNEFNYGPKEEQYKIEDVTFNGKKYVLRCHAREIWCLIKHLTFILAEILDTNDPLYKFGLRMVDLLDNCMKPSYGQGDLLKLEKSIEVFNKTFLELFHDYNPERKLRPLPPKAHHLLHYPRVTRQSGPIKSLMCMRFEAKHQAMKSHARVMYSRKNLCYSLAKKICFHYAHSVHKNETFLNKIKEYSKANEPFHSGSSEKLRSFVNSNKVNFCGNIYKVNDFVLSNCLKFALKILQIGVDASKDSVVLIVEKFVIEYVLNKRAYKICKSTKLIDCLEIEKLMYPSINKHLFNECSYLRLEHF